MDLKGQIVFYDKYWSELKPFSSFKLKRVVEILKLSLEVRRLLKRPISILDLGCGDGRSVAVWSLVGTAVGLDLSERAMQVASKIFPNLTFLQGNAVDTPFESESFDLIISQEVIEHLTESDQVAYVKECHRLLKPNGFLILTTPNKFYFDRREGGNYSNQPIENLVTPKELCALLKLKFDVVQHTTIIPAKGNFGIYRLIDNQLVVRGAYKLGLSWIYEIVKNRLLLSLNQIVLARKKA